MPPNGASVSVIVMLLPNTGVAFEVVSTSLGTVAFATVSTTTLEVAPLKVVSPGYAAVMESVPTGSAPVVKLATPELLSVPVPMAVDPLRKVTVPVG